MTVFFAEKLRFSSSDWLSAHIKGGNVGLRPLAISALSPSANSLLRSQSIPPSSSSTVSSENTIPGDWGCMEEAIEARIPARYCSFVSAAMLRESNRFRLASYDGATRSGHARANLSAIWSCWALRESFCFRCRSGDCGAMRDNPVGGSDLANNEVDEGLGSRGRCSGRVGCSLGCE
jgi:hypothetical protein